MDVITGKVNKYSMLVTGFEAAVLTMKPSVVSLAMLDAIDSVVLYGLALLLQVLLSSTLMWRRRSGS